MRGPEPQDELPERPDRRGYCWDCTLCGTRLSDHDPIAFVDGKAYCFGSCATIDNTLQDKPHFFVGTRNVAAASVRFDYTVPASTIHVRTDAAARKPKLGTGPRIAWIREVVNGRPLLEEGVLF